MASIDSQTTKLKTTLDGLKRADDLAANSIERLRLDFEGLKEEVADLKTKKDDTAKLKESYKKFTDNYNTTVEKSGEKTAASESLQKEESLRVTEQILQVNETLCARLSKVEGEVASIQSALESI